MGMHRSGTSAMTGVLSQLGGSLGNNPMPGDHANPKGYFENNNLVPINEAILDEIDSAWDDIFFDEEKASKLHAQDSDKLKFQIRDEFKEDYIFAIKDPRITFLFPLYRRALEDLDIKIKVIIPFRNPFEVASSLARRDGFSIEKGILLWTTYFLFAEQYSREYERVFVEFDEMLADPKSVIRSISDKLNIDLVPIYVDQKDQVKKFLERGLKHHNYLANSDAFKTINAVCRIMEVSGQLNDRAITGQIDRLRNEYFESHRLFFNKDLLKIVAELKHGNQIRVELERKFENNIIKLRESEKRLIENKRDLALQDSILLRKDKEIDNLKNELIRKDKEIDNLKNELIGIYTGRSWRWIQFARKLKRLFK
jgi:hypothetical protein